MLFSVSDSKNVASRQNFLSRKNVVPIIFLENLASKKAEKNVVLFEHTKNIYKYFHLYHGNILELLVTSA